MSIIAWKQGPELLVNFGDAIASFLDVPDVTTEGNCIMGKTRFEESRSWDLLPYRWDLERLHWFGAACKCQQISFVDMTLLFYTKLVDWSHLTTSEMTLHCVSRDVNIHPY